MENPTQMLRNFAAANSVIKKSEAKKALNLTKNQVSSCFDTLIRQGYLTRIGHGLYKSVPTVEKPVCEVTEKIWRAMKVKRVFAYADIAMLADTTKDYVYKLFRGFRAEGYVKPAGARPTYGSGTEKLFRLTIKGQNKARKPNIEQFKPDPLVMDTVNLNRLVCSGLVIRKESAAKEAIVICHSIIQGLKEDMKR
ncbi:MAG: hypothetical protein L3J69_05995 [Desulfobacula sp.]|nr:hypothetical protein [Desulfobacula sp.]